MDLITSPEASLLGLLLASFLAATLLPGGSELAFVALLLAHPDQLPAALLMATLGNTLGGMTTYGMAWGVTGLLPEKVGAGRTAHIITTMRQHGTPVLILAWAPLIGDLLCAAAGWLRLPWRPCLFWMALGKAARYGALALVISSQ
jgi:membrane protein YqaA with SNARE-associated domain